MEEHATISTECMCRHKCASTRDPGYVETTTRGQAKNWQEQLLMVGKLSAESMRLTLYWIPFCAF